jgi:S-adenosylmethionine decarboxylase
MLYFPLSEPELPMTYMPGTHLIATLQTDHINRLHQYASIQSCIDVLIFEHGLQKLGEVYHDFSPAGYTGVVCLSESHISVHTWPEYGRINIDIYLSNYKRNNDGTVQQIYHALQTHFGASVTAEHIIHR